MEESEGRPLKIRRLDPVASPDGPHAVESSKMMLAGESTLPQQTETNLADEVEAPADGGDPISDGNNDDAQSPGLSKSLSKNQLKKLRKKQEWEAGREHRKIRRKEKLKEKKARRVEEQAAVDQVNSLLAVPIAEPPKRGHSRPIQVPVTFVLDCDFDDLMTEPEMKSLASQLTRCYSDNKSASYKAHLVISSFGGKLKQRFDTILASSHLAWKGVKFTDGDFVAAAKESSDIMKSSQGGRLAGALAGSAEAVSSILHLSSGESIKAEPPFKLDTLGSVTGNSIGAVERTRDYLHYNPLVNSLIDSAIQSNPSSGALSEDIRLGSRNSPVTPSPVASGGKATGSKTPIEKAVNDYNVLAGDHKKAKPTYPLPSLVYLTSDSPNTLDVLSPYTTYVIGGLVDKNRHKGICYKRAVERDVSTAKLPIGEYMTMQSRTVLATNHVLEIMVRWLEDGDWGKAFLRVIPKRKEAKLKIKAGIIVSQEGDKGLSRGGRESV